MTPLLTPQDVAEKLSVSTNTVRTWARTNQIPHYRIGKRIRLDADEIKEWLDTRREAAIPNPYHREYPQ